MNKRHETTSAVHELYCGLLHTDICELYICEIIATHQSIGFSVQGVNARAPNGSRAPDKRLDPTPRSHRKAVQRAPETLPLQGGGFRECRPWNHDRGKQVETLPYAPNSFGILGPLEERNGGISDVRKDPAGKLTTLPYPAGRRRPVASSKPGPSKSQKRTNW